MTFAGRAGVGEDDFVIVTPFRLTRPGRPGRRRLGHPGGPAGTAGSREAVPQAGDYRAEAAN